MLDGESSFEFKATYKHQILSLSISSDEHGSVIEQTKQINKNSKYSEVKDQLIACVHATDPTTYQFDHFEDEQGQRIYDNRILDHNQMIKAFFSIIPITIGDYSYAFDKVTGSATVIAYLGSSEEITVPDNVQDAEGNNYKVTAIGYRAFYDSNTATKITLPSSCIELGEEAFFHCSKLTLVTISKDIKYLPTRCFEECEKLVDVAILNGEEGSVREVGHNCFSGCNQAVFTSLPKSIEILDDGAFSYCENLKSIELPNIVSAGKGCF
ncbi:MAG: leucine-rich repeat domain-containing protein [Mycoplasmoidaceae bacterium]|nr:leucine-rich repeat domain-containing protein [Mycoplasmoidaceae bacterium]